MIYLISFLTTFIFFGLIGYLAYLVFIRREPVTAKELAAVVLPSGWVMGLILVAYNLFWYDLRHASDAVLGLGAGLFNLVLVGGLLALFLRAKRTPLVYGLAGLGTLAGGLFAFRASDFVQQINVAVALVSLIGLYLLFAWSHVRWEGLWLLQHFWLSFKGLMRHVFVFLKLTFTLNAHKNSGMVRAIKTALLTFAVVVVFGALLMSADPVFEALVSDFSEELVERAVWSIAIGFFAAFLLSFSLNVDPKRRVVFGWFGFYDVAIPVFGLVLLFGLFLFVQAKYLFGWSHADFQTFDLTYSDYARKGFIELMVTAFLGGLVAYGVILKTQAFTEFKRFGVLRGLNVLLIFELFALLASAWKRDVMYMDAYGLTRMRLIGEVFLWWLAVLLLLLLALSLWKRFREREFFGGVFAVSVVAFVWFNAVNMDRLIALSEPPEGQPKDYFYLASLSADAVEAWGGTIASLTQELNPLLVVPELAEDQRVTFAEYKLALQSLLHQRRRLEAKFGSEEEFEPSLDELLGGSWGWARQQRLEGERSWAAWNGAEQRAYDIMRAESALFYNQLDCLIREVEDYQVTYLVDFSREERNRLFDFDSPFLTMPLKRSDFVKIDSLSAILGRALESAGLLVAYQDKYEDYSGGVLYEDRLRKDVALWGALQASHVPAACPESAVADPA